MQLSEKTKLIQRALLSRGRALPRFGADGDYGDEMADALLAEFDLVAPAAEANGQSLILGTGKNITRLFIHCSATREGQAFDAAAIRRMHMAPPRNWRDIGYHFVLGIDGTIERGRPEDQVGAHAAPYNTGSLALCYIGGLDAQARPKDTRTSAQLAAMERWCREALAAYPGAELLGHRDISPDLDGDGVIEPQEWLKACPCFDVKQWWASVQ